MSRPLIEESYKLSTSVIKRPIASCTQSSRGSISDQIHLSDGKKEFFVSYWLEKEEDELSLTLSIAGSEPQRVRLTTFLPPFGGERLYFECPECGRRCEKLYLAPKGEDFKCNRHFIYEASTINRQSVHGMQVYQQSRLIKVMNKRTDIHRIWYKDTYTQRFCRFLKMAARAGLVKDTEEALKFLEMVNLAKAINTSI